MDYVKLEFSNMGVWNGMSVCREGSHGPTWTDVVWKKKKSSILLLFTFNISLVLSQLLLKVTSNKYASLIDSAVL